MVREFLRKDTENRIEEMYTLDDEIKEIERIGESIIDMDFTLMESFEDDWESEEIPYADDDDWDDDDDPEWDLYLDDLEPKDDPEPEDDFLYDDDWGDYDQGLYPDV